MSSIKEEEDFSAICQVCGWAFFEQESVDEHVQLYHHTVKVFIITTHSWSKDEIKVNEDIQRDKPAGSGGSTPQ